MIRFGYLILHDRNLTSHAYDEMLADEIFARIKTYIPYFEKALQVVQTQMNED